jgi:protein-tyrosine phosphatase
LATNAGRTLIHCSIGKDRTGLLAALVLHALGVPREMIVADYMVSRAAPGLIELVPEVERILRRQLDRVVPSRVAERLLSVEESYLLASFQAIESRCGSLNNYLQLIGCGGELRAQLQARLLE